MHYIDEGDAKADPILLLHGEPSWSYLYRKMIPLLVKSGKRIIAPDLIGFGKSDKPSKKSDYSYQRHVDWMTSFIKNLNLQNITLFCQDWGSLIGLRIVAENQALFSRVILANGGLPTGDFPVSFPFKLWQLFARYSPYFPIARLINLGCQKKLNRQERKAYEAPFPTKKYESGARIFPSLVPISPDDPASEANRQAWEKLMKFNKPFLTTFGAKDPFTLAMQKAFLKYVPGTKGLPHQTFQNAGHFVQEDCPEELSKIIIDFLKVN